jgi:CheY-like chemotaxis protein
MSVLVAHETETIREITRRLVEGAGYTAHAVADGRSVVRALDQKTPPRALVVDVALPDLTAYQLVEEVRRRGLDTRVVLIASIYNRTGYKRRPTSLYGADDYVEQHHLPDALVGKLQRLIGPPEHSASSEPPPPHAVTPEGRAIKAAGEARLDPVAAQARAERLARLIVADIALYNGDAIDHHDDDELQARLRMDLEEGRLLFDLRVPIEVRRTRDFIGEALEALRAQRRAAGGA